jgi:DNA primase
MAGIFSNEFLNRVRSANDIVDVIGSYLPLKKAGANFVALCPFHKEKTPSFHVNPHRQIFHCFGCNKGGDIFSFVRDYESVDFPESVKRLADRAKIPLEYEGGHGPDQQTRHLKDSLYLIHEQITERWVSALANEAAGQLARDYLAKRRVPDDAIKLFRLGCAPEAWDDTVNWARSKGHDLALVEKAGLIIRKEGTDRYYDRFRGRLIFPICDEQGRVIGFSGRILAGDDKTAKYVNSPESPIFTKSKVFFGLDKSKRAILDAGFAVVCEGQLDLISCFMAGVQNIVAPQGTAFTAEHARILRRYVEEVVLCFDSDEAGQNAAVRSLDHLLGSGIAVRVAVVPAPHDPDSFIKAEGGEAFKKLIGTAEGFFDFYLQRLCRLTDVSTDRGRLAVLRGMAETVNKTANGVLIDKYAQKTALRLGVKPEAVRAEFAKSARTLTRAPEPEYEEISVEADQSPPPGQPEFWLLKLLLLDDDLAAWAFHHLSPQWVRHPVVREVVSQRLSLESQAAWQGVASLLDMLPGENARSLVTEVTAENRPIPNPLQQLKDLVTRLRNQAIDQQLADLVRQMSLPDITESQTHALLQEQQRLRQLKKRSIDEPLN